MSRLLTLVEAAGIGVVLTALSVLLTHWAGWLPQLSWLEVVAVATSYSCTYLCVVQSRMNYPIGMVTTGLYCWLLWRTGLYASAVTSGALSLWLVYGWFRWGPDRQTLPVSSLVSDLRWDRLVEPSVPTTTWVCLGYLLLGLSFWLFSAWVSSQFSGSLPVLDGAILGLTAVAQLMLDNKRIETWAVWVLVNVVTIYVYLSSGLVLGGVQYVLFLANTVVGWWAWHRDARSLRGIVS